MKNCNVCCRAKSRVEFSKRAASPDGLNYTCRACSATRAATWRADHPGAFAAWYDRNRSERAAYWKQWYSENTKHRAESYAAWAQQNKHVVYALIAKRRAAKLCATPAWSSDAAIREIFKDAAKLTKQTGVRHEVDHIYPLQSDVVCGLHCEANLQILTKVENLRKHNRVPAA